MVDQDNSPIKIIREKEEDAKTQIAERQKQLNEKHQQFSNKLTENLNDFESILREKGNEKLKATKIEATEMAKTEIAKANKERKAQIDIATAKKTEAINSVVKEFQTLISK
ncbi:MAG: hypothetical protein RBS56_01870 [Candidatus Gracilibacteria bacterium]|jgi:vacuolar-type H+-ATPase subunit H|nr:hypothetical protein [Candidatus Gracilibacteria bacterium]